MARAMRAKFTIQTLATAYEELASKRASFHLAVGNFMNSFFLYAVGDRQRLLDDPIQVPDNPSWEQRGWAGFCAASAEYLAGRYDLRYPEWAQNPAYAMPEPWYIIPNLSRGEREDFQETAPEPFQRRNIFCSDRVFSNPHPSSREPGSAFDLARRRQQMLASMPEVQRVAYIAEHNSIMPAPLRITDTGELAAPEAIFQA